MSVPLWLRRAAVAVPFAMRNPHRVVGTPLPALWANSVLAFWRRRGVKILLFYIDHEEYWPFVRPIWKQLPNNLDKRLRIYVISRPDSLPQLRERMRNLRPAPAGFWTSWVGSLLCHYDLFVTTHPTSIVPLLGTAPRVCTFHGLPAKGGAFAERQWRFLDGALLSGPLQKRLFDELRAQHATAGRLWAREVGYPKSDALLSGHYHREDVLRRFGLDPDRPTVFYAPSWEEHGSLRVAGREIAAQLCRLDVNVLVKLHPMSYYGASHRHATGGVDWATAFDFLNGEPRFRHVRGGDASPLVAATDVLITDVSSVAYEALLLDRPVIVYDSPRVYEEVLPRLHGIDPRQARDDLRFNCGREAALVIRRVDQLVGAVKRCLDEPHLHAAQRKAIRDELLYHPGRGAEKTVEAIFDLMGLDVLEIGRGTLPERCLRRAG
jgi:hypothetical protein